MTKILERISLAWVLEFLRGLFNRQPMVPDPEETPAAPAETAQIIRMPKRQRKTQERPDAETFSELLDGLEESFASMQIPAMKETWLPRSDIRALHKVGVYIPTPWQMEYLRNPVMPQGESMPAIASCLMLTSKHDTESRVCPRFAFAIKAPHLPAGVEQHKGTPYRFGYCVQLREREKDKNSEPRMFWVWAWVVVGTDGRLTLPLQRSNERNVLRHNRRQPDGRRSSAYVGHQWRTPSIVNDPERSVEDHTAFLLSVFRQLVMWWNRRDEQWSVGVRKDGRRVTFNIAKEHTAAYFADREKVVTVNGNAKKIIHFVREHTRSNGQTVREHVRGMREFIWHGFSCHVTAPRLTGAIVTKVPAVPVVAKPSAVHLTTEDMAQYVANREDFEDMRTHRRAA